MKNIAIAASLIGLLATGNIFAADEQAGMSGMSGDFYKKQGYNVGSPSGMSGTSGGAPEQASMAGVEHKPAAKKAKAKKAKNK